MTAPSDDRQKTGDRGPRGQFTKGNRASPGRSPGRGPVAEMRATLATDLHQIIDTLRAQALAGDLQAIRIILDRVLPALRPVDLPMTVALPAEGTLAEQGRAVVRAAAEGDLALTQAAQLLGGIASLARLIETDELVARVAALESRHGKT